MSLSPGTRLGPYEIQSQFGAGGMGEVYKATDTRLDRTVAIKVLLAHVADDPDLRQRFEREAKTISSLNHPHICTLHDIGQQDGTDYLVMEYLEGETLAERLTKGALPMDQALRYAVEIADALDKAHRKGITHRDLKPGNIMVTKAGTKLLDFGLAKLMPAIAATAGLSAPPTQSAGLTQQGTIIGTLQYMAPEQLEGKDADARTDIFAFGATVYEMVTGKKAFEGSSQASLISAIMTSDPPSLASLQPISPPVLNQVVKTCLAKDPDARWETAGDVGRQLHWIAEGGSQGGVAVSAAVPARGQAWPLGWVLTAAAVVTAFVAGAVGTRFLLPAPSATPESRLVVTLPPDQRLEDSRVPPVAISPDGTTLVYVASAAGGRTQLFRRPLDNYDATVIDGTEGATAPFFSPDGRWLGFYADGQLQRVSMFGGSPLPIAEAPPVWSATWSGDDSIIFATTLAASGLWYVSADGGTPEQVTSPRAEDGEQQHVYPQMLLDGEHVLFTELSGDTWRLAALTTETGEWQTLGSGNVGGEGAKYLPTGHIVYSQSGAMVAVPFDASTLELLGSPIPLLEAVDASPSSRGHFAVARDAGTLVYLPARTVLAQRTLLTVDRDGRSTLLADLPMAYEHPTFSPDGTQVAVTIDSDVGSDVWVLDVERGTRTRLTANGTSRFPVWHPSGAEVTYYSTTGGSPWTLYAKPIDGRGEGRPLLTGDNPDYPLSWSPQVASVLPGMLPQLSGENPQFPMAWSADGSVLAFDERKPTAEGDIWVLASGTDPSPFLLTSFDERSPAFSLDGGWLAYVSDESGRDEIYVQPYPGPGRRWAISVDGGDNPIWSPDGRQLFYRHDDRMMAVQVRTGEEFDAGEPVELFEGRYALGQGRPNYDVSPDGQRFVMIRTEQAEPPEALHVVLNWFDALRARAAEAR